MAGVFNCGFARVAVKHSVYDENDKVILDKKCRRENYLQTFGDCFRESFSMSQAMFSKRSVLLLGNLSKWRGEEKSKYIEHFSQAAWKSLSNNQKAMHTVSNCKACQMYHLPFQSLFPTKSNSLQGSDPIRNCVQEARNQCSKAKCVKPTQRSRKEAAKSIYLATNRVYKEAFKVDLSQALVKVPELQLQHKKSRRETKTIRRTTAKEFKKVTEEKWKQVDCDATLGSRQSFSQRDVQRKALYFESFESAQIRSRKRKALEEAGERKKKRHSPDHARVDFDKAGLLKEVNEMTEGEMINFSKLASQYGASESTKVGNMVVKEFLQDSGVNIDQFQHNHNTQQIVRRRLNRTFGGEITTPVPRTNKEIQKTLKTKIESGEYCVGEMVVPRRYKKITVDSSGNLVEEEFTVSGRKIPLLEIRKRLLEKHEREGLVRDHAEQHYDSMTDEQVKEQLMQLGELDGAECPEEMMERLKAIQRTRHMIVWSDHSSVLNHGHLLMTVNILYDPAFYWTPQEMHQKTGRTVDVQAVVETPHIYLMGRCRDTVVDQLSYSETRLEDLRQLNVRITSTQQAYITDVMRFHRGDHPEQEAECGKMAGGSYGCCGCIAPAINYTDIIASLRAPHITLAERRDKVIAGPAGRKKRNGGVTPFVGMKVPELKRECQARGLPTENLLKPSLQKQLRMHLGGIQRVPSLLFPDPSATMEDLKLQDYEVIPVEPLHDIKEHIANVIKELPGHLTVEEKALFDQAVEIVLSTKEKLRGSDYRLFIVILAIQLGKDCRLTVRTLLYTLTELSSMLYAPVFKRSPRFILRLYNIAFCHAIAFKKLFQKPQVLTYRKLFGIYFHSITCHAPRTSRLISLSAVNTEEEERQFSAINHISKGTSSRRPGHIIPNYKQNNSTDTGQAQLSHSNPRLENLLQTFQISQIHTYPKSS